MMPQWALNVVAWAVVLTGCLGILSACLWASLKWLRKVLMAARLWDDFFDWWWALGEKRKRERAERGRP
jgi:hypothetical protein